MSATLARLALDETGEETKWLGEDDAMWNLTKRLTLVFLKVLTSNRIYYFFSAPLECTRSPARILATILSTQ